MRYYLFVAFILCAFLHLSESGGLDMLLGRPNSEVKVKKSFLDHILTAVGRFIPQVKLYSQFRMAKKLVQLQYK